MGTHGEQMKGRGVKQKGGCPSERNVTFIDKMVKVEVVERRKK